MLCRDGNVHRGRRGTAHATLADGILKAVISCIACTGCVDNPPRSIVLNGTMYRCANDGDCGILREIGDASRGTVVAHDCDQLRLVLFGRVSVITQNDGCLRYRQRDGCRCRIAGGCGRRGVTDAHHNDTCGTSPRRAPQPANHGGKKVRRMRRPCCDSQRRL